jgi:hypothetical protein
MLNNSTTLIYIFLFILILLIILNQIFYEKFDNMSIETVTCSTCDAIKTAPCNSDFANVCSNLGNCKVSKTDADPRQCYCVFKR